MIAPIILFVYNRPFHTRKTLESLELNFLSKESELFIFADGPKENASKEHLEKITETRKIIREKKWCGKINIIEKERNSGLANSVIVGVTEIINKYGKVIVLEDDLLLSKNFLKYMNDSLEKYEKEEKVMQIAGYMYPVEIKTEKDAFFLPFISSWGWGTWKRVWDDFDKNSEGLEKLKNDKNLRYKFNLNGSYPYYKMLKNQVEKNIDSWAIRFYLTVFMRNGLILFPKRTLVNNIGMDGSGVHCKIAIEQDDLIENFSVNDFDDVIVRPEIKKGVYAFLKKQMNIIRRAVRLIRQILN
ncbi:MAG: glycosyltransferase family A protein [Candidatus Moraniibacteriota bacterium]